MQVKELIERLEEFPADLEVTGMYGSAENCLISVLRVSSEDEIEPDGEWDYIVISLD